MRKKTVTLPMILPVWGIDRGMFNYWFRQGRGEPGPKIFCTKFSDPPGPGVPREFTRTNCLEVAFFLAIFGSLNGRLPVAIKVAIDYTSDWLRLSKAGTLGEFWCYDDSGNLREDGFLSPTATISDLAKKFAPLANTPAQQGAPREARRFDIVNVREIVRQIDELFGVGDGK
jgi:hypothetical protein